MPLVNSRKSFSWRQVALFGGVMSVIGITAVVLTFAAGPSVSLEAENGSLSGGATVVSNSSASGGKAVMLGGAGTPSPTATPTATPTPTPGTGTLPSSIIDLTNWKLTVPVETSQPGSPDEYKQPQLATFTLAPWYTLNAARNGVQFRANAGGATTSGSSYPRSELREMTSNGTANASWSTTSGTHTMTIDQAITHLPDVKPHVVAGQIHDAADDVIVIRLEGTKLFVDHNGVNGPVLNDAYVLGTRFKVQFVASGGHIKVLYNDVQKDDFVRSTSGCYFKAGAYTQSNLSKGDAASAYGEVIIYDVKVTHS